MSSKENSYKTTILKQLHINVNFLIKNGDLKYWAKLMFNRAKLALAGFFFVSL